MSKLFLIKIIVEEKKKRHREKKRKKKRKELFKSYFLDPPLYKRYAPLFLFLNFLAYKKLYKH
jgi:hypothetical protein